MPTFKHSIHFTGVNCFSIERKSSAVLIITPNFQAIIFKIK